MPFAEPLSPQARRRPSERALIVLIGLYLMLARRLGAFDAL